MIQTIKQGLLDIRYDLYLLAFVGLTFLSYIGIFQDFLMPLLVGIGVLVILGGGSVFYIIPIPFFVQMSFSDLRDDVRVTTIYTIVFTVLIVADMLKNRTITRRGHLTIPLAILVGLSVLTHINSPDLFTTFAGFMQVASVLGLYFYFINTLDSKDDNFRYVSKMMMYIGVLVSLEMMYFIYDADELVTTVIRTRQIDLGWENLNIIIYANLMSIPLIAYLIHESKVKFFYMVFALLNMIGIFLTLSRSSVLTLVVFVLVLLPTMFVLSKQRKWLLVQGLVFVGMVALTVYVVESRYQLLSEYLDALNARDLTYVDDRLAILGVAWDRLLEYPLFGGGGLYSSRVHLADAGFSAVNYHNTLAQASALGFAGVLGFFYLFLRKTELIMLSKSPFKWYALILIFVTAFVNGALQPMYFYTTYMVFLFLVLAAIEVNITPGADSLKWVVHDRIKR